MMKGKTAADIDLQTRLQQRIRANGLRVTRARIHILCVIAESTHPLDGQSIFRQLMQSGNHASLGTVYRVADELLDCEILTREWSHQRRSLTARPGLPVWLVVGRDLSLRPYQAAFSSRRNGQ